MRKGQSMPLALIISAVILMVVAFVVIFGFKGIFGKGITDIGDKQDKTSDGDLDGVIDLFDVCPCDAGLGEYDGCNEDPKQKSGNALKQLREKGCDAST